METDKRNGLTEPGRVEQSNHDMNESNVLRVTRAHDDSQVAHLPLEQLNSMVGSDVYSPDCHSMGKSQSNLAFHASARSPLTSFHTLNLSNTTHTYSSQLFKKHRHAFSNEIGSHGE